MSETTTVITPVCPYCGSAAVLTDSAAVYGASYGKVWLCGRYPACDAYVGTHGDGVTPLGTLADAKLRGWRQRAHEAFDPLWQKGGWKRAAAYAWLARELNLADDECHIGMMDVAGCLQVIAAVARRQEKPPPYPPPPRPEVNFRLTLKPLPNWSPHRNAPPVPVDVRKRRLLKALLRGYGFKMLDMEDLPS